MGFRSQSPVRRFRWRAELPAAITSPLLSIALGPDVDWPGWATEWPVLPFNAGPRCETVCCTRRDRFDDEHDELRRSVQRWLSDVVVPRNEEFEAAGIVDRAVFRDAGKHGFLGMSVDPLYGGEGCGTARRCSR
jgi:alkylation response protein AidB-like acyl-CoA dehydrogenase